MPVETVESAVMVGLSEGSRNREGPRISWLDNVTLMDGVKRHSTVDFYEGQRMLVSTH